MNQEELIAYHKNCCDKMTKLISTKNTDYSGIQVEEDAFANFRKAELLGICSVEQGLLVRISDKLSRVISFMQRGELLVKDESVQDTLLDGANYLLLLAAYLESKKDSSLAENNTPTDFSQILEDGIKDALKNVKKDVCLIKTDNILTVKESLNEIEQVKKLLKESEPIINKDTSAAFVTTHTFEEVQNIVGGVNHQAVSQLDPEI